jgi:hypothetical protein
MLRLSNRYKQSYEWSQELELQMRDQTLQTIDCSIAERNVTDPHTGCCCVS